MRKIKVLNHITLDGVLQAPGKPEEDPRDGFAHGGWSVPYGDSVMAEALGFGPNPPAEERAGGAMLFGRRTYEDLYDSWHGRSDNPFTALFEKSEKYVVSATLTDPLPWNNSTLLAGDTVQAVSGLKETPGPDLLMMGSAELIQTLMGARLIDEFKLLIYPLVLGTGRRLFTDPGAPAKLRVTDSVITTTGVVIVTYEQQ
ncbi:MAG TPA: dihydrofolate reductase family protein [Solirubrobacteraceae bacterium]|jgi:dihydrofolate reductase|nr:dihydrofolate reductase family protein [Solirubrobacteraceae bacterium]